MNNCLICILFIALLSCSEKGKENFIPLEYHYPIKKIGNGKQFTYDRVGPLHEKSSFTNLRLINHGGKQFLVKSNYCNGYQIDSIKTTTDGKLIEIYNFHLLGKTQYEPLKGKIIESKIIDDGSKFGKRISNIVYKGLNRNVSVNQEEKYLYDTIIDINGLKHKSFVTETKIKIRYTKKDTEVGNETLSKKSYYVKGLELYCYNIESRDDSSSYFQMSISELNK